MKVEIIDCPQNLIETIYKAYRVCYSKDAPTEIKIPTIGASIRNAPDTQKMLDFIKSHISHESPLEHISFTFAIEGISRITEQQSTRHRLASFSIQSGRYVNKSNSDVVIPPTIIANKKAFDIFLDTMMFIKSAYDKLIALGIPKEDARYIVPQGQETNMIVTMNTRELIHFFGERLCKRAQWEIRDLAEEMRKQVNELLPIFDRKDVMKCGKSCNECIGKEEDNDTTK